MGVIEVVSNQEAVAVDSIHSVKPASIALNPTLEIDEVPTENKSMDGIHAAVEDINSSPPLPRTKLETFLLMSALSLANLLVALDTTIITTALAVISKDFQSSIGYSWIGTAYILATAVTTPIWAKFSDIWGRKPLLLIAIGLFFVGSLLCGFAVSMLMLILARVVQGLAGGGVSILVTICISDSFSMRERPLYFGIIGMTWAFASAIGPLLGGILTEKASWKWCFFINLPCSAFSFLIVFWRLRVHNPRTSIWNGLKAVDWLGSFLIIAGTLLFLLALQLGGVDYAWSSPLIISFLVTGILLALIFVVVEWKVARYPLMPLRTFYQPNNIAALGVAVLHSMVLTGGSFFLPLYFQGVLGASPLMSGAYLIPLALSLSIVNVLNGFAVRKTGQYLPAMRISTLFMALGFGLFIDLPAEYNWTKLIVYQIIAGIGIGPNFQCPLIALQASTPQADHAAGSSTFNFLRNLSASITIVISSSIFQNEMQKKQVKLKSQLGPTVAGLLDGKNAAANVQVINSLPPEQRFLARAELLNAMLGLWIMYMALAVAAFACSLFCRSVVLSEEHKMTTTGLGAEEEKRLAEKSPQQRFE
ncbi:hypothetical protein BP5796_03550 [Coleophoma crateriformis]|uniref:Efflux pump dotC n=1 Tax=Coleophoma crateriformis TaxID=565419 RepID=A0A3D8SNJ3_9HELO|nr:hypothetical protein BP5796_03550 [Coleophoma crateriformis]